MSKVDLTKVAGFKAVDAEGNDMGIVSLSEMTNMVKESIINEAVAMQSVSTLAETSTRAATDTYEDKLDISDTFSYVRTLDSSGNPKRTSQNALATVVGGLLPNIFFKNNGNLNGSANDVTGNGSWYCVYNDGIPLPELRFIGILSQVFAASLRLQLFASHTKRFFWRIYFQSWSDWKEIGG